MIEDGFYWVRNTDGQWWIGELEDGQWYAHGVKSVVSTPDEIGERIERRVPMDAPDLVNREARAMAMHFGVLAVAWEAGREEMREQWRRRVKWAMDRYLGHHGEHVDDAVEEPTLRDLLRDGEPIKPSDITAEWDMKA